MNTYIITDRNKEIDQWLEDEKVYEEIASWLVDDNDNDTINEVITRGLDHA